MKKKFIAIEEVKKIIKKFWKERLPTKCTKEEIQNQELEDVGCNTKQRITEESFYVFDEKSEQELLKRLEK